MRAGGFVVLGRAARLGPGGHVGPAGVAARRAGRRHVPRANLAAGVASPAAPRKAFWGPLGHLSARRGLAGRKGLARVSGHAPRCLAAPCDVALEQVSCGRPGLCGVTSPGGEERLRLPASGRAGPWGCLWGAGQEENPAGARCLPSGGSTEGGAADAGGVLGSPSPS